MYMDTDSLRWFQQVADGTTVTEVSELEEVTQSGVSRALARLEGEIGTPLLQRSGRILRMTHAGAVFKRHVDAMLHQLDDGIAAVSQLIEPDTGLVALAFQHSLGTWLVPDLVRSFRAAHPNVRFQLTQVRDELHSSPLAGGQADLGDRDTPPARSGPAHAAARPRAVAAGASARSPARRAAAHPARGRIRRTLRQPAADVGAAAAHRQPLRRSRIPAGRGVRGRRPVDRPRLHRGRAGRGHRPGAPGRADWKRSAGRCSTARSRHPGAVREITLTWSAERRLLPAADLFRRHVIRRATTGRVPTLLG